MTGPAAADAIRARGVTRQREGSQPTRPYGWPIAAIAAPLVEIRRPRGVDLGEGRRPAIGSTLRHSLRLLPALGATTLITFIPWFVGGVALVVIGTPASLLIFFPAIYLSVAGARRSARSQSRGSGRSQRFAAPTA